MEFLKAKFFDAKGHITDFLSENNQLLRLEEPGRVPEEIKKDFVEQFIKKIVENGLMMQSSIDEVKANYPKNSWSIDFPSWLGEFNEKKGKKVMIIGSEPHIHYEFLQTVYGFNNERQASHYLQKDHPIFRYISTILADKFGVSKEEVLYECYLTDLFPLSPYRGEGVPLGSPERIQAVLGKNGDWIKIRSAYAQSSLPNEIKAVKPQLIITQGVTVFLEVLNILQIRNGLAVMPIFSSAGKRRQFIRRVSWNEIPIISVPHIGSGRMRTFWNNNLEAVKNALAQV